jgi:hypothetical protein
MPSPGVEYFPLMVESGEEVLEKNKRRSKAILAVAPLHSSVDCGDYRLSVSSFLSPPLSVARKTPDDM